ncbi:hypothetical protein CAter282_3722 [Collimonas arenae]|uniref:Uncharacterized protein n=1 Tax=Collimonas arenae TaxID=279058 RepID=A0A127PV69_9BURK|nr:hypothetical protein CAter10_4068 [Collimonas arenae]AMP11403.1 hypothetical protein CAter282_3722 [Collimonas arenae]
MDDRFPYLIDTSQRMSAIEAVSSKGRPMKSLHQLRKIK